MSFFKHVQLHEYDLTNKGISQACYDELVASGNNSNENQLRILADSMREEFKDYMRTVPVIKLSTNPPHGVCSCYTKRVKGITHD